MTDTLKTKDSKKIWRSREINKSLKRLEIIIPSQEYKNLKEYAAIHKVSMGEVVRQKLNEGGINTMQFLRVGE